jgi:RNA polymerase-binding transcription factor DksA
MKKDAAHLQQALENEKKIVTEELKNIGVVKDARNPDDWQAVPGNIDTTRSDPNEVADRLEAYEGNNALVNNLEARLNEIDAALDAIKNNTYGVCHICKKEIETDRLEANPAATTCKEHMNA